MSSKSNNQGRAYEYACLHSLQDAINQIRPSQIVMNSSYVAAQQAWETLEEPVKALYWLSAQSTIDTIFALEPNIVEPDSDILSLYIQADRRGEEADVRDIIIQRKEIKWEVGLSIKHNHLAVKHSRIAKSLDFGTKWYGVKCSQEYWDDVRPVFDYLEEEKGKGHHFADLKSKHTDVYLPLLNAFMKEVGKQVGADGSIPRKLAEYLLSKYDFYKVISIDKRRITTIQSFNMYGKLNLPGKTSDPKLRIPLLKLPTTLVHIGMKPRSKTTVIMCFDNGWQFSFRLHSADGVVAPSVKLYAQLVGMPAVANVKFNCKW